MQKNGRELKKTRPLEPNKKGKKVQILCHITSPPSSIKLRLGRQGGQFRFIGLLHFWGEPVS